MIRTGQERSRLVKLDQNWSEWVRNDQDWSGMIRTGQWAGMIRTSPYYSRPALISNNLLKLAQEILTLYNLMHLCTNFLFVFYHGKSGSLKIYVLLIILLSW